ncbi:MAG: 3'-5' exonuclease domain-containing protein 2 [Puniceicoccales bacterium]|jgi:ribonuclease D|nr:3'-5' exonuclease domain-containing protein 2 [Puniceicoccales bacterium]
MSTIHKKLSPQDLASLPLWQYAGKIILIRDGKEAERAVELLLGEECLGFDTETRPTFQRGQYHDPALVQVALEDVVYLFQLVPCGGLQPLLPLFTAAVPAKICLGVEEDLRRLRTVKKFTGRGFVELLDCVRPLGILDGGLRKLCANLLGVRISKREQTSNWARQDLTERQLRYAATDAWVSRKIFLVARELRARGTVASD